MRNSGNSSDGTARSVIVTLRAEGTHRWEGCGIDSVQYLRNTHRHLFHITCRKRVEHSDRDVEFITLKRDIAGYLESRYGAGGRPPLDFGGMSCEMIAEDLLVRFGLSGCTVMEDGENGAECVAG